MYKMNQTAKHGPHQRRFPVTVGRINAAVSARVQKQAHDPDVPTCCRIMLWVCQQLPPTAPHYISPLESDWARLQLGVACNDDTVRGCDSMHDVIVRLTSGVLPSLSTAVALALAFKRRSTQASLPGKPKQPQFTASMYRPPQRTIFAAHAMIQRSANDDDDDGDGAALVPLVDWVGERV
jgi:hypothetical protein